jgi:hypothetical protein
MQQGVKSGNGSIIISVIVPIEEQLTYSPTSSPTAAIYPPKSFMTGPVIVAIVGASVIGFLLIVMHILILIQEYGGDYAKPKTSTV